MEAEDLPTENGDVTEAYPGRGDEIHVFQYDARRLEEHIHPRESTNGFYESFADVNLFDWLRFFGRKGADTYQPLD
jgi:hypothetical protein